MDDALRLRHRMIPYLHTMNWRASRTGLPLVEPMYWGSPDIDAAYHVPNEYMFGTELLAAPITEPMDKSSRRGKADVWLPPGGWFDFFTQRTAHARLASARRNSRVREGRRHRADAAPVRGGFHQLRRQPAASGDHRLPRSGRRLHADGGFGTLLSADHPGDHRDHLSMAQGRRHIRTHGIASPGRRSRSAGPENMGFPVPRHYRQRHIRTGRRRIRRFGSPV